MALTAGAALLGAVGFLRRLRRGHGDLSIAICALVPFGVLAGQSYGGEALLRCFYFAIPFLAILGALAFAPRPAGRMRPVATLALAAVVVGSVPAFVLARYGNEAWDSQTRTEHGALEYVYANAPSGATVLSVVSEVPWGYQDLARFEYVSPAPERVLSDVDAARARVARASSDAYLVVTRGQVAFGRLFAGLPPTWGDDLVAALVATDDYTVVFQNDDAVVLLHRLGEPA
jgi:hypothetical protein